jgi:hypothetical protein
MVSCRDCEIRISLNDYLKKTINMNIVSIRIGENNNSFEKEFEFLIKAFRDAF